MFADWNVRWIHLTDSPWTRLGLTVKCSQRFYKKVQEKSGLMGEDIWSWVCVCWCAAVGWAGSTGPMSGGKLERVQVLESYVRASTDRGSISRAGSSFSPGRRIILRKRGSGQPEITAPNLLWLLHPNEEQGEVKEEMQLMLQRFSSDGSLKKCCEMGKSLWGAFWEEAEKRNVSAGQTVPLSEQTKPFWAV